MLRRARSARRALAAACVLALGCGPEPMPYTCADAERLCQEERFDEAIALLNRHLCDHPGDPDAHLLLGRCYLAYDPGFLVFGEGEYETALALFKEQREKGSVLHPIPADFEYACYVGLAEAQHLRIQTLRLYDAPETAVQQALVDCADSIEHAKAIAPDSEEVKRLESRLNDLQRQVPIDPEQRQWDILGAFGLENTRMRPLFSPQR